MKLVIANKNYSSWSLRAWLLLQQLQIEFEEVRIGFNEPDWHARIRALSPAGRVPVLLDGEITVWDTLAIAEYVAERFPEAGVWPSTRSARSFARSVCAEMHSGFGALRTHMPMNIEARLPGLGWNLEVQDDIDRVLQIWTDARAQFGHDGAMLFGRFCAADAFYAPVVWRFVTHGVELPEVARTYMDAVRALPAMQAWEQAARVEHDYVAMDEPYRRSR